MLLFHVSDRGAAWVLYRIWRDWVDSRLLSAYFIEWLKDRYNCKS